MPNSNIVTFAEAIDLTLLKLFKENKNTFLIGLGANDPKGIFGTTKSITKKFSKRVFDMPLSENSMTGLLLGSSLSGFRPILVHQRLDFALLSMEQIINQAAKWNYMFDGKKSVPIIIRMIVGRGWGQGPQHSQSLQSIFAHIPGLKVVMPSTTESVQNLLYNSFHDNNPVIFIEHRWLHNLKGKYLTKLKKNKLNSPKILKKGRDLTIVSNSLMTIEALRIIKELKHYKISIELIDLQIISPLNINIICKSVKKTGRLLVLDTGHKSFGISAEIISKVTEKVFNYLKIKPERIANPDFPVPTSFAIARYYYPKKIDICIKIFEMLGIKNKQPPSSLISKNIYLDQPYDGFTGPF